MSSPSQGSRLRPAEVFGLHPLGPALADAARALFGDGYAPRNRWGTSSVRIFKPWIGLPTWLGRTRADRRVPIYNFFNRMPEPRDAGYSVRVTTCRDFRGGRFTYDGHLGTDFACPVGTPIVAAAPGVVLRVKNEMDRGGLGVCVDHGRGLVTTHNHLSRALVKVGDRLERGRTLGLSGASGMEFVTCFPWVSPHLHYNTWLNGDPTDPFALPDETSLWRARNDPTPHDGERVPGDEAFTPTPWDPILVDAAIDACRDPEARARARAPLTVGERAAELLMQRNYRPATFTDFPLLTTSPFPRSPVLDLPFRATDFVGAKLPD